MWFLRCLLLAAAFSICTGSEAVAGTFHVSSTGSDSNAGSLSAPWKTLQHAVDTIGPGDTILVESGTYTGCRIGSSGQAGAPCTLKADAGATVLVNQPSPGNKHNSNIEIENFDSTASFWLIDGFEVTGSARYGIDIRVTESITVQNCNVHNSALTGIFLAFSNHPLLQNNESSFNGEHGIYQSNSGHFPTIRGNKLHHNHAAGIHMNGDRNFTPGDGLILSPLVEKNVIFENGVGGGSAINCDGVTDGIIRNNLMYNNHASGISLFATDGSTGSSRNLVYNNTIVMATGSRWCINIPSSDEGQPDPVGNKIKNNILYQPDSFRGSVDVYSRSAAGFESDFNIVVNHFSTDAGDTSESLAAWQAVGFDPHSTISTPAALFVDAANNDYHLKTGSPAVGAGTVLPEVTDDLDGMPRPTSANSIGCLEAITTPVIALLFSPADFSIDSGKLKSGGLGSLAAADGDYVVIKTVDLSGTFGDSATFAYHTGLPSLSFLNIIVTGRLKAAPQIQTVSVFNFSTNAWEVVDTRTLSNTGPTRSSVTAHNPAAYISGGQVEVRVTIGGLSTDGWKHFIDSVVIAAAQ